MICVACHIIQHIIRVKFSKMYPSFVAVTSDKSAMPLVPLNDKDKKIKCDGNKVGFKQTTACNYSIAII